MSDSFDCAQCGSTFQTEDALRQHDHAKHYKAPAKTHPVKSALKKHKGKLIVLVILAAVAGGMFFAFSQAGAGPGAASFPPRLSAQPMHTHSELRILIDGNPVQLPSDVGIGRVHQPLHTHEADNVIHVESSDTRDYTLGNFFQVWGKQLSSTCVMDYCTGGAKRLSMTLDGVSSTEFDKHVLRDGEVIVLNYG